jgi:hypothetical protein
MFTILGVIFGLFVLLFIAIVIEELFVGGRKLRQLKKLARERSNADNTGC